MPYHPKYVSHLGNLPCFVSLCGFLSKNNSYIYSESKSLIVSVFVLDNEDKTGLWIFLGGGICL